MKIKIGVMGSAQGPSMENQGNIKKAIEIGKYIAESNCILVNGACPGLPDEAAYGAHHSGGFVMGISPAFSEREHIERYKSPHTYYDLILYSGLGLMERDIINIRSSDAIVLLGGGVGTLNEFTVAFDEGKIVGVLEGTGGVADHIKDILRICNREVNGNVVFEKNPRKLINKILKKLKNQPQPISEDERVIGGERVDIKKDLSGLLS